MLKIFFFCFSFFLSCSHSKAQVILSLRPDSIIADKGENRIEFELSLKNKTKDKLTVYAFNNDFIYLWQGEEIDSIENDYEINCAIVDKEDKFQKPNLEKTISQSKKDFLQDSIIGKGTKIPDLNLISQKQELSISSHIDSLRESLISEFFSKLNNSREVLYPNSSISIIVNLDLRSYYLHPAEYKIKASFHVDRAVLYNKRVNRIKKIKIFTGSIISNEAKLIVN